MWKILGALLWGLTLYSNALIPSSSMLESEHSGQSPQHVNVLTENEYDYIVSVGSKLANHNVKYLHFFFGNMITPRYGFTYINHNIGECNRGAYYVKDKRRDFELNDLKRVKKFINFKDFIANVLTEEYELSVGMAVFEMENYLKDLTTYVPTPTQQPNVNYMVGFNWIETRQPRPDRTFVKLRIVKADVAEYMKSHYPFDFGVKVTKNGIRIDANDLGSLVYLDSRPVGINVGCFSGCGLIKLIDKDDYAKVEQRCKEESADFTGESSLRA